jgi:hypothetical protein
MHGDQLFEAVEMFNGHFRMEQVNMIDQKALQLKQLTGMQK